MVYELICKESRNYGRSVGQAVDGIFCRALLEIRLDDFCRDGGMVVNTGIANMFGA